MHHRFHPLGPAARLQLAAHAAQMRAVPTASERILWSALRAGQLGVVFRRQVPVGRFIADFLAPAVRLVVEVDGVYHEKRCTADARRDRLLARMGYRVLHVDAELVERDNDSAVAAVRDALAEIARR